jgi:hypothetical protein
MSSLRKRKHASKEEEIAKKNKKSHLEPEPDLESAPEPDPVVVVEPEPEPSLAESAPEAQKKKKKKPLPNSESKTESSFSIAPEEKTGNSLTDKITLSGAINCKPFHIFIEPCTQKRLVLHIDGTSIKVTFHRS